MSSSSMTSSSQPAPSERTRVRRLPKRAHYDRQVVHSILDGGNVCHVGFVVDGQPVVIPTVYGRRGEELLLHGSTVSRMLTSLCQGVEACVTVTLVDGLVLARSAFHHSMNYRSVMVFGTARLVEAPDEKLDALKTITNHVVPDRWDKLRAATEAEVNATTVLALPLSEASAKIRTGPPVDAEEDYSWPVWAGVVPLETRFGTPADDGRLVSGVALVDLAEISRQ